MYAVELSEMTTRPAMKRDHTALISETDMPEPLNRPNPA